MSDNKQQGNSAMSLDKAIEHGHEHRKPYKGAKRFDKTCRNHGSCNWCQENRTYKFRKKEMQEENSMHEFTKSRNNRKSARHYDDIGDELDDEQ